MKKRKEYPMYYMIEGLAIEKSNSDTIKYKKIKFKFKNEDPKILRLKALDKFNEIKDHILDKKGSLKYDSVALPMLEGQLKLNLILELNYYNSNNLDYGHKTKVKNFVSSEIETSIRKYIGYLIVNNVDLNNSFINKIHVNKKKHIYNSYFSK